jgi:conjugal transfer/entry exclusion protein
MQNIKENIKTEISKSLQCLNWDLNEVRNQINFVFNHEESTVDNSVETLNSLSENVDKIKMLLNLLKQ